MSDSLSAIFADLRLRALVAGLSHFGAPWGFRYPSPGERKTLGPKLPKPISMMESHGKPKLPAGGFHLVTAGLCWLEVDGEPPVELRAGDLAVIVQLPGQTLRDSPETPAKLVFDFLPPPPPPEEPRREVRLGGRGATTSIIEGGFFFDSPDAERLLPALPPLIHVRGNESDEPWLPRLTDLLLRELTRMQAGAQAIIDSLAGILFVQAVRQYLAALPPGDISNSTGAWTRALLDPEIGKALAGIHRSPARPWSVAALADHVLLSRSAFAARFTSLVGQPPMNYLAEFRMRRAQELLRRPTGTIAVKEIARLVGYDSESAFSNAFKRRYGVPPREARKQTA